MDKQSLDDWFDNKFCSIYQNPTKIESARKIIHRYQPDEKTLENILQFVMEDNRRRKFARDRKEFYAPACNAYSFFNESRWMDKIKSRSDLEETPDIERRKCSILPCRSLEYLHRDNPKKLCSWNFSKENYAQGFTGLDKLREQYSRLGLCRRESEGHEAHISRLRAMCRTKAPLVGKVDKDRTRQNNTNPEHV